MPKNGINNITLPVYIEIMKMISEHSLAKIEVSNIQSINDEELNSLKVGDVVQKKTGSQKHCYIVTYKEEIRPSSPAPSTLRVEAVVAVLVNLTPMLALLSAFSV